MSRVKRQRFSEQMRSLIEHQAGCFSTAQVKDAGFSNAHITYMKKAGLIVLEARGVYRSVEFEADDRTRVFRAALWAKGQGIIDGEAAAWWRGEQAHAPEVIRLSMPARYAYRKPTPPSDVELVFRDLEADQIIQIHGVATVRGEQVVQSEPRQVDDGDVDLPKGRPVEFVRTNLVADESTFVGRETEISELTSLIGDNNWVTIAGPAGMGKTRLARETGRQIVDDASFDEVWFIDAHTATTGGHLRGEIVSLFHLTTDGDATDDRIGLALASRDRLLLILDNLEQLESDATVVVERWLSDAPETKILATSRRPVSGPGNTIEECVFRPQPMTSGRDGGPSDGARLFAQRFGDSKPSEAVWQTYETIVERVDGLPLAIELTAARSRILGVEMVEEQLRDRVPLTAPNVAAAPPRHQTLQDAINWSWDALSQTEQLCLSQCACFAGGFSVPAAGNIIELESGDPFSVMQKLVQYSMLHVESAGRLRMLQTIRSFVLERGHSIALEKARQRHRQWYGKGFGRAPYDIWQPFAPEAATELRLERDNLLAALASAIASGQLDLVRRLVTGLMPLIPSIGPDEYLERCLGPAREVLDESSRYAPLWNTLHAMALSEAGRLSECLPIMEQAVGALRGPKWRKAKAWVCGQAAHVAVRLAERDKAEVFARQAKELEPDEPAIRGLVEAAQARVMVAREQYLAAEAHLEAAESALDAGGDVLGQMHLLGTVAQANTWQHKYEGAQQALQRMLEMGHELGLERFVSLAHGGFARLTYHFGQTHLALFHVHRALAYFKRAGNFWSVALLEQIQARIHLANGAWRAAERCGRQALSRIRKLKHVHSEAVQLLDNAFIALAQRRFDSCSQQLELVAKLNLECQDPSIDIAIAIQQALLAADQEMLHTAVTAVESAQAQMDAFPRDDSMLEQMVLIVKGRIALLPGAEQYDLRWADYCEAIAEMMRPGPESADWPWGSPAPAQKDLSIQLCWRLLSDRLPEAERRELSVQTLSPSLKPLVLSEDGALAILPDGREVSLARRANLKRILSALLRQRTGRPTVPLSLPDIIAAGWPDEQMLYEAGVQRAHAELKNLRRAGFKGLVKFNGTGYQLDPDVPVLIR